MCARTIESITRATDTVGRMSGDSFGIVLQGTGSIGATAVGARLAHHLDRTLQGFAYVRAEIGTATGTGVNAAMLPTAAADAFPLEA
jgi:GGDEF domain-containing protein